MKKFKRITIMILAVLPMIYSAVAVFFFLPDTVAAHFGIDGTPDRYGSKYEAFLFPAIILVITLLYFLYRKFQEKSFMETYFWPWDQRGWRERCKIALQKLC